MSDHSALRDHSRELRESIWERYGHLWPREPGAVDQLAALGSPDGEAGELVRKWKNRKPPVLINPDFYGTITVENL